MPLQFLDQHRQVYFLHIPKAAGTSFRVLLENAYHVDEICPAYDFFSLTRIPEEQLSRYRLFRGHLGYNLIQYLPQRPFCVTMLRDPVKRAVSHFEYIRRDPNHPLYREINERNLSLKDFVSDPRLRWEVEGRQVRLLSQDVPGEVLYEIARKSRTAMEFQQQFNAARGAISIEESLERAMRRLEEMEFVGLAERFNDSARLAAYQLGLRPPKDTIRLNVQNRNPSADIDAETRALIEEANAQETTLYRHAQRIFEDRYRHYAPEQAAARFQEGCRAAQPPVQELQIDFAAPLPGDGWWQREHRGNTGLYRWTGPEGSATLDLPLLSGAAYRLELVLPDFTPEPALESLALFIDDTPIEFGMTNIRGRFVVKATLAPSILNNDRFPHELRIHTALESPQEPAARHSLDHNNERLVGIPVSSVRIQAVQHETESADSETRRAPRAIIYQMGKVASTALVGALEARGVRAVQSHFLDTETFHQAINRFSSPAFSAEAAYHLSEQLKSNLLLHNDIQKALKTQNGEPLAVVTMVREPLDWYISNLTQNFFLSEPLLKDWLAVEHGKSVEEDLTLDDLRIFFDTLATMFERHVEKLTPETSAKMRVAFGDANLTDEAKRERFFLPEISNLARPHFWHSKHFTPVFDVDLERSAFNPSKGFGYHELGAVSVLLVKYEALSGNLDRIASLFNIDELTLERVNTSKEKAYGPLIREASRVLKDRDSFLSIYHDTPYYRKYYGR